MCEALGTEPLEEETPIEFDEFLFETQQAIQIYRSLPEIWGGGMQPFYVGKDYTGINTFFEVYDVDDGAKLHVLDMLQILDREHLESINRKIKSKK